MLGGNVQNVFALFLYQFLKFHNCYIVPLRQRRPIPKMLRVGVEEGRD